MPEQEYTRRLPYVNKKVADIKNSHGRVAILGTIVSKDEDNYTFAIDDGNAQAVIILNDIKKFQTLEKGKLARVMGRIIGSGEEAEILGDVVQDFGKINIDLYNKHIF